MKTSSKILLTIIACTLCNGAGAATIVSAAMWISIADGGYPPTPLIVADGAFPPGMIYLGNEYGFEGGQVTVRLAPGEEVINAGYRLSEDRHQYGGGGTISSSYYRAFSLIGEFPQLGSQIGDQVWAVTPHRFIGFSDITDFAYAFVVETNFGTFENGFEGGDYLGRYVGAPPVPEPSVPILLVTAFGITLRRRR